MPVYEWESLFSQRKFDDQAAHNFTRLIILPGTVGMAVMAAHASRTERNIGINRMKV